ncbi:MAG: hypothetical protein J1E36_07740, partial [Eubacterium sp.]|nr:hypothetical protein [Eubacterium sp.]
MKQKSKLGKFNVFLAVVLVVVLIVNVVVIVTRAVPVAEETGAAALDSDPIVIDELTPDTYGGV